MTTTTLPQTTPLSTGPTRHKRLRKSPKPYDRLPKSKASAAADFPSTEAQGGLLGALKSLVTTPLRWMNHPAHLTSSPLPAYGANGKQSHSKDLASSPTPSRPSSSAPLVSSPRAPTTATSSASPFISQPRADSPARPSTSDHKTPSRLGLSSDIRKALHIKNQTGGNLSAVKQRVASLSAMPFGLGRSHHQPTAPNPQSLFFSPPAVRTRYFIDPTDEPRPPTYYGSPSDRKRQHATRRELSGFVGAHDGPVSSPSRSAHRRQPQRQASPEQLPKRRRMAVDGEEGEAEGDQVTEGEDNGDTATLSPRSPTRTSQVIAYPPISPFAHNRRMVPMHKIRSHYPSVQRSTSQLGADQWDYYFPHSARMSVGRVG
ncbi:hypothetical protein BJ085DRAFT_41004, partial [Dimargaris cristalligena]